MARIDTFLRLVVDQKASDLHLIAGSSPTIRVNGDLFQIKFREITPSDCEAFIFEILSEEQRARVMDQEEIDFAYTLSGVGRFRVNVYTHRKGIGAAFRIIPNRVQTFEELNLPSVIRRFAFIDKGLVLITGPTGSGKSTTLSSLIDIINAERQKHILTIEEPIEFIHEQKQSLITQREVGRHTENFRSALRSASRGSADVILVGEMRDLETISLALTCAETGSLVFATLHTISAAKAISRIVDSFPSDRQSQVRSMLSASIRGVVSQQLVKRMDGRGRVPVLEILVGSTALANLIREGRTHQINSHIETSDSAKTGMMSLDQSLLDLLDRKLIHLEVAMELANDKERFRGHGETTAGVSLARG